MLSYQKGVYYTRMITRFKRNHLIRILASIGKFTCLWRFDPNADIRMLQFETNLKVIRIVPF